MWKFLKQLFFMDNNPVAYYYCINEIDKTSNNRACFVYRGDVPFHAISPLFPDSQSLKDWMQGKFVAESTFKNKYGGFDWETYRLKRINFSPDFLNGSIQKSLPPVIVPTVIEIEIEDGLKIGRNDEYIQFMT